MAVFVVAVLVRLVVGVVVLAAYRDTFPLASDDGANYDAAARWTVSQDPVIHDRDGDTLRDTQLDPAVRWPAGYWLFLAGQYRLLGHQYLSAVVLQALLGGLAAFAAFVLAQQLLSERAALAVGLFTAVSGTLVNLSSTLSAESLYIPLLLCGLWLTVRAARTHRCMSAIAGGACFALATVTRPLGVAVAVVALAWMAWLTRKSWVAPIALAAMALTLVPFALRDVVAAGHVLLFSSGGAEAFHDPYLSTVAPYLADLGADPYAVGAPQAAMAVIRQPFAVLAVLASLLPGELLTLFVTGGWGVIGEPVVQLLGAPGAVIRLALLPLMVLGMLRTLSQDKTARAVGLLILAAVVAMLLPVLILGKPLIRYRAPADPLLILWLVGGACALASSPSWISQAAGLWVRARERANAGHRAVGRGA